MNKLGNINLSGWSGVAVSVGIAGFMAFTEHSGWAIFFAGLAFLIAIVPRL